MGALWLCILRRMVFVVCFVRMSVCCQLIIIIIDTVFFVMLACVCTGGVLNYPAIQGKLAQRRTTRRKVRTRRHLFLTGVLCVACRLCVSLCFLGLPVSFLRQEFTFRYRSVILCVCVCAEVEQEQHKETRTVSTRGHVLFTGVLCVACLLFVFLSRWLLCSCLCRLNSPESRIQMS